MAFARGDSMDGGDVPIKHGDALLFEWTTERSGSELVGHRVLVEQTQPGGAAVALKELQRLDGKFVLHSSNPSTSDVIADGSKRITARLVQPLDQVTINPWANIIGERRRRLEIAALYGAPTSADIRRAGHARLERDALLPATLDNEGLLAGAQYVDHFDGQECSYGVRRPRHHR